MLARALLPILLALGALVVAQPVAAQGVKLVFVGGTTAQRETVRTALAQSAFPWEILPEITVLIEPGLDSWSKRRTVALDADLLDAGTFSWGVVQHEFAHQVDFVLLTEEQRYDLAMALGASTWWGSASTPHGARGAERFASTLAWSYWPSPLNVMRPQGPDDESSALPPAAFRRLLSHVLGVRDVLAVTDVRRTSGLRRVR